ncbi:MAG: hypothetical protein WC724_03750, partial [Candidatus Paceibacterota bacterium]
MPTIREQMEAKYGKTTTPVGGGSVRSQMEAKYNTPVQQPVDQSSGIAGRALNKYNTKVADFYGGKESLGYKATLPVRAVARTGAFLGDMLTYGTQKFGKSTAKYIQAPADVKQYTKETEQKSTLQNSIIQNIEKNKKLGLDTSRLETLLSESLKSPTPKLAQESTEILNRPVSRYFGEGLQMGTDIAGLGSYGVAGSGANFLSKGVNLTKATSKIPSIVGAVIPKAPTALGILKNTAIKSATGAAIGEGYDITQNI